MKSIEIQARHIWDTRAKIPHSMGKMEDMAVKCCSVFNTLEPELRKPVLIIAASDHGVVKSGVSSSKPQVTLQMTQLFKKGNGVCALMAKENGVDLKVEDLGIGKPTGDFSKTRSMSPEEVNNLLEKGISCAASLAAKGCNTVLLGEMGIGNTSASGAVMSALLHLDASVCCTNSSALTKKTEIIRNAVAKINKNSDVFEVCSQVGGREIVFLAGVILGACKNRMLVVSDGFNTGVAVLIAGQINNQCTENIIFSHCTGQKCHRLLLKALKASPTLNLDMCLGEGSGALAVIPLIRNSLNLFNNLESFRASGVKADSPCLRLPFCLGTSSYIIPADIIPNVKYLEDKVDDVELVLFESMKESNLPTQKTIEKLKKFNLSYTVHLPYDVKAGSRDEYERKKAVETWLKVIKLTSSLDVHGFIVHLEPDCYDLSIPSLEEKKWRNAVEKSLQELSQGLGADFDRSLICVETLGYDLIPYLDLIKSFGFSITLDAGHLFKCGLYSKETVEKFLPYTRIIHLHGVDAKGHDHRSLKKHADKKQLDDFLSILFENERKNIVLTLEIFSVNDFNGSVEYLEKRGVL